MICWTCERVLAPEFVTHGSKAIGEGTSSAERDVEPPRTEGSRMGSNPEDPILEEPLKIHKEFEKVTRKLYGSH